MRLLKYFFMLIFFTFSYAEDITPIPLHVDDINIEKARLGKKLFFDPILSKDGSIACVNCHILELGGDDGAKASTGIDGLQGNINSPTVLNSRYNFVQFWNGRAEDLEEQAMGPIENPVEMGNSFPNLIKTLKKSSYSRVFKDIYKDGVTKRNIVNAIAEYEKTLITPNSAFDQYLRGDENALTKNQKKGYELFQSMGCIACHNGVNIGGNLYNKVGFFKDADSKDTGRFALTNDPQDKFVFKVPTLRNIAKTAPYLHDGRFETLEDAVKAMISFQLGIEENSEDVDNIVSFLKSLDGELVDFE